jgi:hypothetical protein
MEHVPDCQQPTSPGAAAPVTGAPRPQRLATALVVAYGALLLFVVSIFASVFGLW